jgi:hypothetical protein
MKTSPAQSLRLVVTALALLAVIGLTGCRRPFSFFERPASPDAPSPRTASSVSGDLAQMAIDTVGRYLDALHAGDYSAAYAMLSRDSQSQHTREDFVQQAKRGMPNFDIKTARTPIVKGDTASLVLSSPEEDAKSHAFHLVLEDGQWKIVYLGGGPGQPYADQNGNKGN